MRALRLIPVLLICLFLTGGHYGMLQCVAWAGMLWSYSAESGLAQAAEKTFDGQHPCCLCKAIAQARQEEPDAPDPVKAGGLEKLKDLQCPPLLVLKDVRASDLAWESHLTPEVLSGRCMEAPVPPPPRGQV